MHGNDAGMFQARDDLRFANHALPQIADRIRSVEDLDCYPAIELFVFGEINGAHSTRGEFVEQPILRGTEIRFRREFAQMIQPGV